MNEGAYLVKLLSVHHDGTGNGCCLSLFLSYFLRALLTSDCCVFHPGDNHRSEEDDGLAFSAIVIC